MRLTWKSRCTRLWLDHVFLFNALCLQHGVSQEDILRRKVNQQVKDATYDLASLAHTHLTKVCYQGTPASEKQLLL